MWASAPIILIPNKLKGKRVVIISHIIRVLNTVPLIENIKVGVNSLASIKLPITDFNIPIKRASFNPKKIRANKINIFANPRRIPGIGVGKKLSTTNIDIEAAVNIER